MTDIAVLIAQTSPGAAPAKPDLLLLGHAQDKSGHHAKPIDVIKIDRVRIYINRVVSLVVMLRIFDFERYPKKIINGQAEN